MRKTLLVAIIVLIAGLSFGQQMPWTKPQFLKDNGQSCAGCLLYSYAAGGTPALATYSDSALTTPNANPIVLDSAGRASIFLSATSYKFTLKLSTGVTVWSYDNVHDLAQLLSADLASTAAGKGDALIGYKASGTGAAVSTVHTRLASLPIDVKADFGAAGDGNADDTAEIANAIAAAVGSNRSVYFPAGTYLVSSNLSVAGAVFLYGDGVGSILKIATAGTNASPRYIISLSGATNVRVEHLKFLGASVSAGTAGAPLIDTGIYVNSTSSVHVEDCIFDDLNIGINCDGASNLYVSGSEFDDLIGGESISTGYGILASSNAHYGVVTGNKFFGNSTMRHAIYVSAGSSHFRIENNYADATLQSAINVYSLASQAQQHNIVIANNVLDACVQETVSVYDGAIGVHGWAREVDVTGNTISNSNGSGILFSGLSGDATNKSQRHLITGNTVYYSQYSGIRLEGVWDTLIVGNRLDANSQLSSGAHGAITLTSTPGGGSAVTGAPVNCFITANLITGASHKYGVDDQADHTGAINSVIGNTILSAATSAINDGNSVLKISGNYTGAASETYNTTPLFTTIDATTINSATALQFTGSGTTNLTRAADPYHRVTESGTAKTGVLHLSASRLMLTAETAATDVCLEAFGGGKLCLAPTTSNVSIDGNVDIPTGGLTIGGPTGGLKGTGTININGDIYKNNTAYTSPDYVFAPGYSRMSLEDLEQHIARNARLPGINNKPMGIFERSDKTLEKIEELTLYIIELKKEIDELKQRKP